MSAVTAGAAPAILPLRRETLPLTDLAPFPHAVTWALVWREGQNGKPGAWTKVLRNPRTGRNAKSNDPTTWGWPDDVLARFDRFGFVVWTDDPFTFLDLDNAVDRLTRAVKPWAWRIVEQLPGAYWEYSTTGSGLKGLVRGHLPRNRVVKVGDGQVELFFSGKFTALTGHRLPGASAVIGEGQADLDALYARICPEPQAPIYLPGQSHASMDDEEVIRRCRSARNAAKFADLFDHGNTDAYGSDASDADLALIALLTFWTQDPEQLDRLFRRSALMRDKWELRPDYRRRTIAKACAGGRVYLPPATVVLGGLRVRRAQLRGKLVRHA